MEDAPRQDDGTLDRVALIAIGAVVVGLIWLAPTDLLGFDPAAALAGVTSQLPITLPAAILVSAALAANIAAGAVVIALVRRTPFESYGEAALAGLAGAVVLDCGLLFALGGPGWFRAPVLLVVHAAILGAAWLRRPIVAVPWSWAGPPTVPWALVGLAWAGVVVVQLASPVVPFIDVLPNHVAPVEHLRTFGELGRLDIMPSPIYGPSRAFLGYTALLGVTATMTGLPAGLAVGASILPQALLVALGVRRLGRALGGPGIELWALLAFTLTASFARLTDARANVLVLALVTWALARFAEATRSAAGDDRADSEQPTSLDARLVGLGLGAAVLIHPVLGGFGLATIAAVALAPVRRAASIGIPAVAIGVAIALPQIATTLGVGLPAAAGLVALPAAVAADAVFGRLPSLVRLATWLGRGALAIGAGLAILIAPAVGQAASDGLEPFLQTMPLLLLGAAVGLALARRIAAGPVALAGLAVGAIVAVGAQLVPDGGLLGQSIRFELPKELDYWIPAIATVPAAIGLAALWHAPRLPAVLRAVALAGFLVAAALPLRGTPIDDHHRGEHRLSEALAIDLRFAGRGYWLNYPDARRVIDAPRQELVDAVRSEITAGRLGPSTAVLHVAASFQQWVATPLGVFGGVIETTVSPDAEVSIHTAGGRLRHVADLPALLAGGAYPYLLLEPAGLEELDLRPAILAAGYEPIFANGQGELFALRR